jgi:CRP-like cAMP-binding protein
VNSGEASLTMHTGDKEIRIRAGQSLLLGIPAIVANQPYSMTATACWEAQIFRLSSVMFDDLIKTEPRIQQAVLRILAREVRVERQALSKRSSRSDV